jgi:hypothetical protein
MVDTAYEIQKECERLVRADPGGPKLECEVWHQRGSGTHRCVPYTSTHFVRDGSVISQVRHDGQKALQNIRRPHQHRHTRVRRHSQGKGPCRTSERTSR